MTDSYDSHSTPWNTVFGGVKFVSTSRDYSEEICKLFPDYQDRVQWAEPVPTLKRPTQDTSSNDLHIEKHLHTKKGFIMYLVVNSNRVSRDVFNEQRDLAKDYGGWYSRKWSKTPGGFAFETRKAAEDFLSVLQGAES